ncbi:hypothetical protein SETIT_5G109000v2 [Setaria italica]|uniref:Uncharacterized protein n=2 Tax=Setaria italica TaxID=4555 RepID=A0A368R3U0_SETIT|nr:hypothetical protein SETIT_5G109000v2 [Setaria italica]
MAGNIWKAQALERVTEAGCRFDSARWRLLDAVARLAPPAHVFARGARRGLRHRIRLVLGDLAGVSGELALAASAVAAAELVALRGAAVSPMLSIHGRERHALGALRSARGLAEDAHGSVERCRGHLRAALYLLDHPGLPGVLGFVVAERTAAHRVLEDALASAVESEMLVITARQYIRVN